MCLKIIKERKAIDPIMFQVEKLTSITDYFLIASGHSSRQVQAIAKHLTRRMREEGFRTYGTEGEREGQWVLMDYGDVVIHHGMTGGRAVDRTPDNPPPGPKQPRGPMPPETPPGYTAEMMAMLADFDRQCRRAGATAYIIPPPARDIDYQSQPEELEDLFDRLRAEQPIAVIQSPAESAYPMQLFYDLPYHLNKDGADRRTRDVAERLAEALGISVQSP